MPLHIDYRPKSFSEIIGNKATVASLRAIYDRKSDWPHAVLLQGPKGCLRGDTKIYDPADRSTLSIQERHEKNDRFHVVSLTSSGKMVVAKALPPIQYPSAPIFRVETSESVFFVTAEHRFRLATGGYLSLKELSLKGFSSFPLLSSSEPFPLVRRRDGNHYLRKELNFPSHYWKDFYPYDEPLLASLIGGQESFPLQDGVLRRIPVHWQMDEMAYKYKHIHLGLGVSLPSKQDFYRLQALLENVKASQSFEEMLGLFWSWRETSLLTKIEFSPTDIVRLFSGHLAGRIYEEYRDICFGFWQKFLLAFSLPPFRIKCDAITHRVIIKQIKEVRQEKYYDFHVPFYHNYWAGGLFHHNCGKTTIARIIVDLLECRGNDFIEINSSNDRGIGTARSIMEGARFKPMMGKSRVYLLDEVHMTTGDFQNAMLKPLEDTPGHAYFLLCTTDPSRLIPALRSRCHIFEVQYLTEKEVISLLQQVLKSEKVDRIQMGILKKIAEASDGCPRDALKILDQIVDMELEEMEGAIISFTYGEKQVMDFFNGLLRKDPWKKLSSILAQIDLSNPEAARRAVIGLTAASMMRGQEDARMALIYDAFKDPFYNTGKAGFIFAVYRSMVDLVDVVPF